MKALGRLVALTLSLATTRALAAHLEPAKAKKAYNLVNSYFPCSSPDTATSNGTPACVRNAPHDPFCFFDAGGSGKLTISTTGRASGGTQDLKLVAVASGLNAFCEGDTLEITLSYRLTSDDCPEGSCTTVDVLNAITGARCLVTDGKCKINTTLNAGNPTLIPTNGKNSGVEILGCGLQRLLALGPPAVACGVLLP